MQSRDQCDALDSLRFRVLPALQERQGYAEQMCIRDSLTFAGFEPGPADGLFGVRTAAALARFEDASDAASANYRRLDSRTETAIRTLLPSAQAEARRFIDIAHSVNFGCAVKILSLIHI